MSRAVVNAHYLADQIEAWCRTVTSSDTIVSDERDAILDTGGGIARALPLLGAEPFFVLNSDSFLDRPGHACPHALAQRVERDEMDCLLLLCDPAHTTGYDGKGDFVIAKRWPPHPRQGSTAGQGALPISAATSFIPGSLRPRQPVPFP